ncbi:MAG: c-type cytochrome [Gammaproteobacteria bacterium]|jgi:cytochrome c553|nr:c-type cytochrome [Gammaproteobacteria bacterium]
MRQHNSSLSLLLSLMAIVFIVASLAMTSNQANAQATLEDLDWAFAISPVFPREEDDGTLHSLPGSAGSFTLDQARNRFGPADWYPQDHLPMPPIVAVGRESSGIMACSLCHYPNGQGKPENASVVALDPAYFIQQLQDMRDGLRKNANPAKANTFNMIAFAVNMTDEEIQQAAEYYGAMQWRQWLEVVETDIVPLTYLRGGLHIPYEGDEAGEEPIGNRIIEMPVDPEGTELWRNPRAGFRALVPLGAVAAGEALATTGGGKSVACATCHGEQLQGLGLVPPIRGRSPSYLARQLFDFQQGTRQGPWSPLMQATVENLTGEDIINLTAYLASLPIEP